VLVFLETDVAGKGQIPALLLTDFCELEIPGVAVKHGALWSSNPQQSLHDCLVRIAIVNLQCDVLLFGYHYVLFKGVLLQC
jgi:hypothetical protein